MRAEKRSGEEIPSMINAAVVQDRAVISHRLLTEEEADAIWTALNSAPLLTQNQELRMIILKPKGVSQVKGWITRTELKPSPLSPNGTAQGAEKLSSEPFDSAFA